MKSMATKGAGQVLSDECFDVHCTVCSRKNRAREAVNYCKNCKKNLCYDCVLVHNEFNEGHIIVDGHGENKEEDVLTETCWKHEDKVLEMFCGDHGVLLCNVCALLDHRKCEDLKHITDSIDDLNKDPKLQGVPDNSRSALQKLSHVVTSLDTHLVDLEQREDKFLHENEDYQKMILSKIESMNRNAKNGVTAKHEQVSSEAKEKRQECSALMTDLSKSMEDMMTAGNKKTRLYILKKKVQSMSEYAETLSKDSENLINQCQYAFKPDLRIVRCLADFKSLGREGEKYSASLISNTNATIPSDPRPCNIQACSLLPDGTVLLLDDDNKRMKRVSPSSRTVNSHWDLKGCLRGVTCIGPRDVVVSRSTCELQVRLIDMNEKGTRIIKLDHDCYRTAFCNGILYISEGKRLCVHERAGKLIRTIQKNAVGGNMFSSIEGIALNQTGDRVYLADWNNGLVCTDGKGVEVFRRSGKDLGLAVAHGVCTNRKGQVFVCGYLSNNIVQVTEDGRVIGEILSKADGIEKPKCMCYDDAKDSLYVAGENCQLLEYEIL